MALSGVYCGSAVIIQVSARGAAGAAAPAAAAAAAAAASGAEGGQCIQEVFAPNNSVSSSHRRTVVSSPYIVALPLGIYFTVFEFF